MLWMLIYQNTSFPWLLINPDFLKLSKKMMLVIYAMYGMDKIFL